MKEQVNKRPKQSSLWNTEVTTKGIWARHQYLLHLLFISPLKPLQELLLSTSVAKMLKLISKIILLDLLVSSLKTVGCCFLLEAP